MDILSFLLIVCMIVVVEYIIKIIQKNNIDDNISVVDPDDSTIILTGDEGHITKKDFEENHYDDDIKNDNLHKNQDYIVDNEIKPVEDIKPVDENIKPVEEIKPVEKVNNEIFDYKIYKNKNSTGKNIRKYNNSSIDDLKNKCDDISVCKLFSSDGYLKTDIDDELKKSENWIEESEHDLYVKDKDLIKTLDLLKKPTKKDLLKQNFNKITNAFKLLSNSIKKNVK